MNNDNLLKDFIIDDSQRDCFNYYIQLRGVYDHYQLRDLLDSHKLLPKYDIISTIFRYDKRIRRLLFKYITIIEEYLRSYIINNEYSTEKIVDESISNMLFSGLFKNKSIKTLLSNQNVFNYHSIKNKKALVNLRNKVMHSNLLITNKNLEECCISGRKSNSLIDNIINMIYYLPTKEIALSFIKEINEASRKGIKKYKMQLEWNLPTFLIIKIDESILNDFIDKIKRDE